MGVLVKLLPLLATQAAERALANAGNRADEIDALVISTCTGYLCPGLTSYVSERLGCRTDVLTLDLVAQGCVAALPNLCTNEALVAAGRCQRVLSICVEVCSAALYFDDDPGVLVSAGRMLDSCSAFGFRCSCPAYVLLYHSSASGTLVPRTAKARTRRRGSHLTTGELEAE